MFQARPLTPDTWPDLEQLFGLPGGSIVRGCWCMHYRLTGQVSGSAGAESKLALCDLVNRGIVPGLIGYLEGSPVGWISLGPREEYLRLRRSPIMKPVDDTKVWSVVCSYVARPYRGLGLQHQMLAAAIGFARDNGARVLEAYPVDKAERSHDDFMFFGSRSLYERAGFREVVRRSPTRVVMRRALRPLRAPRNQLNSVCQLELALADRLRGRLDDAAGAAAAHPG
jgi:GNAT superfamily N-acetyltransferase